MNIRRRRSVGGVFIIIQRIKTPVVYIRCTYSVVSIANIYIYMVYVCFSPARALAGQYTRPPHPYISIRRQLPTVYRNVAAAVHRRFVRHGRLVYRAGPTGTDDNCEPGRRRWSLDALRLRRFSAAKSMDRPQ